MNQPPVTLADFCQFTIQQITPQKDRAVLTGSITKPGRLSLGQQLSLLTSEDDIYCVIDEFNPDKALVVISMQTSHMLAAITVGATFPVCDSYWVDKLHLITDGEKNWAKSEFVAPDAFVEPSEADGWRKWRVAKPGDENRTDGQIVKGGWDHEHCEICWRHIDLKHPHGYVKGSNNWVCNGCYEKYVGPGDLRFVLEGPSDDAGAPTSVMTPVQQLSRLIDDYDLVSIHRFLADTGFVNERSKHGWTPLMLAATAGHQSLLQLLLEMGADVNAIAGPGYTALALAAQKGFVRSAEKLLEAGATVDLPETLCEGSLLKYVKTGPGGQNAAVVRLLEKAGAK